MYANSYYILLILTKKARKSKIIGLKKVGKTNRPTLA